MSSFSAASSSVGTFVPGKARSWRVFWIGVLLVTVGILIQTGEFVNMRAMGMSTMMLNSTDWLGMGINVVGLALAIWGILPVGLLGGRSVLAPVPSVGPAPSRTAASAAIAAMDEAKISGTHWWMVARLFIGLVLDTMKPATIAFMLPGLRAEYHLTPAQASLLPLIALTGTTLGSVIFGRLGDWIGRRSSFVLTALFLASTAFCGLMPGFAWQVSMCFIMGLAAGGELPLIYAMIVEVMPARHRGWSSVMVGGVGGLCGYLLASSAALLLVPAFSWRVLWLPNLPTALIMIGLIRWIPESPRLLFHTGHAAEAREALAQIGVRVGAGTDDGQPLPVERRRVAEVFQGKLLGTTLTLCLYGFAYGLFNWGFLTWLPTMLQDLPQLQPVLKQDPGFVARLLGEAALIALPGTIAAAALYAFWSSRGATVVFALMTGVVLALFGLGQPLVATHPTLIPVAVVLLLISSSSMVGVLAPYSAELYPTILRGVGSGVVAASSKAGGIIGPPIVGALLTVSAGLAVPSLFISIPLGIAGLVMISRGVETCGRRLEELAEIA